MSCDFVCRLAGLVVFVDEAGDGWSAFDPVGLKYGIRALICGFLVVSAGDLVFVDESAEDRCAVDVVLGEVDGAWWSGFGW